MPDFNILLPTKPRIVKEEGFAGTYEIDGLYPGYGHTLGNSLRRIILSSLPGAAITGIKIDGVGHEFSTIAGVKEDVITIILNLKRVRIALHTDEPQTISIKIKGAKDVTAESIEHPGQVSILNPEQHIATITDKNTELNIEMQVERGLGYISKEVLQKERVEIGQITLDAIFSPIRRVNYEVENMRVGNRTDFNRLKLFIETDGSLTPKEALESSISIMISQLKAIIGFEEPAEEIEVAPASDESDDKENSSRRELDTEMLKTRIETVNLTPRTVNALSSANIRTLGGLVRKKEEDILDIDGLGTKGVQEIKKVLGGMGITLK
ncbi:MAG: DNA-directed RNA polymerase subunit alpha [Candidatus Taylorbacteria bacterium CG11_big_fil_rev_8_21_14_0_20_46_11]|uniref:DNA-directed RNA polymerase subunit alpha n=1 Tax=Candidatus Taylorbacteria bacterium CG11_big_fil_rev_8_21_14_0_20_46_11 TaxID=1975025 RepID=A0A2H0KDD6_9BACT|nr:MAG: DNA-directed RNA polymerase subunit alpha [Candidatus Taylorbacteria bacterium CG11_big_fil_rev_8_21_14_0_20_46_11]